jgi:hypothetical protein
MSNQNSSLYLSRDKTVIIYQSRLLSGNIMAWAASPVFPREKKPRCNPYAVARAILH